MKMMKKTKTKKFKSDEPEIPFTLFNILLAIFTFTRFTQGSLRGAARKPSMKLYQLNSYPALKDMPAFLTASR